ncbi:MAG: flagellar assembly protein FliW [Clostridiales bacterium]|nr:flagellar assembly protein FliW [Clostridiales bacterium]
MEILTRDYGKIVVDEASVIRFDEGILGFEEYRNFVLLDDSSGESPFRCMQSMEESGLAFILLDPFIVKPEYEITLGDDIIEALGIKAVDEVVILAIVVVPEKIEHMSFNLKAPIVINTKLRKGMQYVVENDKYKVRHYIMGEINSQKAAAQQSQNQNQPPAGTASSA